MTYNVTYKDDHGYTHRIQVEAEHVRQAIKRTHQQFPHAHVTRAMPSFVQ